MEEFHFQFVCLPFALITSPRTFTKVLVVIVTWIHARGIHIYHYLDNILAVTMALLTEHLQRVLHTLNDFG